MGNVMGIVIGLLILSVMMIVHELGHYLTGRRLGFKIEEFSIFMGPVLFSWHRNDIKYSIKLLPIGASVKFAGEYGEDEQDTDPGIFFNRPKWARALVIGTGPALNLLSGVLALLLMFSIFGYAVPVLSQVDKGTLAANAGLAAGDQIVSIDGHPVRTTLDYSGLEMFISYDSPIELKIRKPGGAEETAVLEPAYLEKYRLGISVPKEGAQKGIITEVDAKSNQGSPALKVGDTLVAAAGVAYTDYAAFAAAVEKSAGQPIQVTVIRDGATINVDMVATKYNDPVDRGVYFKSQKDFLPAIVQSLQWPWSIIKLTLRSIGMMFAGTIKPQDTLSGPVGVVTIISDVVQQEEPLSTKIYQLLWLFSLVSVSLGFMNLLPIPPLDGNHLVLIVIEAIRGRRLSVKSQNLIGMIGIGLIVVLAVAGLLFDIMRLIGR